MDRRGGQEWQWCQGRSRWPPRPLPRGLYPDSNRGGDGWGRSGAGTRAVSGTADDADGRLDRAQDTADALTQAPCHQPESDLFSWIEDSAGMRDALGNLSIADLSFSVATVVGVPRHLRSLFAALKTHVDAVFARALKAPRRGESYGRMPPSFVRVVKLRYVLNAILFSPDRHTRRDYRFRRLNDGTIGTLVLNLIAIAKHKPCNCGREQEESEVSLRRRVANMARRSDGIAKGTRTSKAEKLAPADEDTVAQLQVKHLNEDPEDIAAASAAATDAPTGPPEDALTASSWRPEAELTSDSVRATIMGKCALFAPTTVDGLKVSHQQSILATPIGNDYLREAHADLWASVYHQPELLPPEWWYLNNMVRLSAKGPKRRPSAVGNPACRVNASAWGQEYRHLLQKLSREVGQFGIAVSGGAKEVAL